MYRALHLYAGKYCILCIVCMYDVAVYTYRSCFLPAMFVIIPLGHPCGGLSTWLIDLKNHLSRCHQRSAIRSSCFHVERNILICFVDASAGWTASIIKWSHSTPFARANVEIRRTVAPCRKKHSFLNLKLRASVGVGRSSLNEVIGALVLAHQLIGVCNDHVTHVQFNLYVCTLHTRVQ